MTPLREAAREAANSQAKAGSEVLQFLQLFLASKFGMNAVMKFSEVRVGTSALLMLLLAVSNAHAQSSARVLVDIAPCMELASSAERYACYDRLEAEVRAARSATPALSAASPATVPPAAPQPASTPSPASVPGASTTVAEFGQSSPSETQAAQVVANSGGEEELHDRITDLQEREPGRWLITLESGQVWYQSNSQRNRLRKGMDVRIYPSPLGGSFRMSQANGSDTGFIQVARIK